MAETPEEFTLDDVRRHAVSLGLMSTLINLHGEHAMAESGTPEEDAAEVALDEHIQAIVDLGAEQAGLVILTLAQLITDTGDQEKVQGWFDTVAAKIAAVLGHG